MPALLAERGALRHPEPVLLVGDDEREVLEGHPLREQRVGADAEVEFPRRERLVHRALFGGRHRADKQAHLHPQPPAEGGKALIVLPREQLGGSHHRRLRA